MNAGRELDVLVAENVMGWVRGDRYWIDPQNPDAFYGTEFTINDTDHDIPPFQPSTDIAAAWLVLDAPILGKVLANVEVAIYKHAAGYTCQFENDESSNWYEADADTAPLAICLAALKVAEHAQKNVLTTS